MYIAVEGVIGVGKTTLARLLMDRFNAEIQLEVFEENPFLADFYSDRARYAFQTQIFFLLSRYHQQRRSVKGMIEADNNLITDYTFAKDSLFAQINLDGDELEMYYKVHKALGEKVRLPDLVIYLVADIEVVMQRIATRDRIYERDMEQGYIETLCKTYNDYFQYHYQGPPVLTIDTTDLDFIKNSSDLNYIEKKVQVAIQETLQQPKLPFNIDSIRND